MLWAVLCCVQNWHRNVVKFSWNPYAHFSKWSFLFCSGIPGAWILQDLKISCFCRRVVPAWLCACKEKFSEAAESKLCHQSPAVLTPFFLSAWHLGENSGRKWMKNDRHWAVSGGKQVNLLARGQGHAWQEGRIQTAGFTPSWELRSHRWTKAMCPTNSSSLLLKIRSRFTHLFSSWVQT